MDPVRNESNSVAVDSVTTHAFHMNQAATADAFPAAAVVRPDSPMSVSDTKENSQVQATTDIHIPGTSLLPATRISDKKLHNSSSGQHSVPNPIDPSVAELKGKHPLNPAA